MIKKKFVGLFEITLILLSLVAFSYLVSDSSSNDGPLNIVSAQSTTLEGCCLETKEGAICQDIPFFQEDVCKTSLVATSCDVVDQCQIGCCYSPQTGTCALRAPKEKCLANGGNWSNDASCSIPQCQLGCCVMGDQVSLTNSRECTLLSNKFNFEKKFIQVGPGETCDKYTGLEKQGACLTDSGDFSGEKKCSFTTKASCRGEFKEDYLCTSEELNTVCVKTKKTTCVDGKDQVYFTDSCGNVANVYDASKVDDQSYWEKVIDPKESCEAEGVGCGNCDYVQGSICTAHEQGKTIKPTFGDYTCKSLHCGEKKHGESWCVYDFAPNSGIAPVGSRHFIARCFEGEISIEGCADFGQEICAQNTDASVGYTEAKCLVNDWRSCINANEAESYSEVKQKCDENPQCIMFNDLYGEDNLKRSDGEFFAGFNPEKTNEEQGSIGDIGKDSNKVLAHCVPRFTPGFQFWTTSGSIVGAASSKKQTSTANYGGSSAETTAVCSLGSFSCVSEVHRDCSLAGGCDSGDWRNDERNWECNYDSAEIDDVNRETVQGKDLPALLGAMNERCRALGSCGVSSNIGGDVNSEMPGFSVKRVKIDRKGKILEDYDASGYVLSSDYISSLGKPLSPLTKLDQLKTGGVGLSADAADSAGTTSTSSSSGGALSLTDLAGGVNVGTFEGAGDWRTIGGLTTAVLALTKGGVAGMAGLPIVGPGVVVAVYAVIGQWVGSEIGELIAKNQGWSPGKQQQFTNLMGAVGVTVTAAIFSASSIVFAATSVPGVGIASNIYYFFAELVVGAPLALIFLAAAIAYTIYTAFDDYREHEYYIMQFTCEAWQPPKVGNCDACNDDVRPCSEYRCKSLGSKCHYFIENGEPGYCATINEIWSAKITPWQEILTSGNQYSSVKNNGFKILGSSGEGVDAWTSLTFGITTDKPASCKIDSEHTKDYSEMKYEMFSPLNPETNKADGLYHQIELNAFIQGKSNSSTTLGLLQGEENEYYIRCMNFAGQVNEAEFVVQAEVKEGPDLTPPQLRRFEPVSGSYLKQGTNSTDIVLYLNEPAECRFDYEYDAFSGQEYFTELRHEMFCLTSPQSAFFGEWSCFASLGNLTEDKNTLFFRCKDQPDLVESGIYQRNANFVSEVYELNACSSGLDINLLNTNTFIEEPNFTLSVSTSGCLGDAVCSFRMSNFSEISNVFFETGGKIHSQLLKLPQGEHDIEVICEDEARNVANKTFSFEVFFDDQAPKILRILNLDGKISLATDEPAECISTTNQTIGCNLEFASPSLSYMASEHSFDSSPLETYFIKCRDKKLNVPQTCSAIIKPIKNS